jgi:hypothetical protein
MPIPRYYRLSVSTGTNCPHDTSSSLEAYVRASLPQPMSPWQYWSVASDVLLHSNMQNTDFVSASVNPRLWRQVFYYSILFLLLWFLWTPYQVNRDKGIPQEREVDRCSIKERFERRPINIQCDLQWCSLVEDVPDLGLELWGERRATVVELVKVRLHQLNSWSCKKAVSFPMTL